LFAEDRKSKRDRRTEEDFNTAFANARKTGLMNSVGSKLFGNRSLNASAVAAAVYGGLQAASGRSGGFEWPLDRVGGQGTWASRFGFAALG
jgi:hypothetical protein